MFMKQDGTHAHETVKNDHKIVTFVRLGRPIYWYNSKQYAA